MKIISFPHLDNYAIPIKILVERLIKDCEVRISPPITKRTLELGSLHGPDFVCIPFKYNLGNFIESLENGANVIVQAGGGCRFAYYAEVQDSILKNLGYKFEFYTLANEDSKINIITIYETIKKINNGKLSFIKYIYYLCFVALMVCFMDKIDIFIRKRIGFEVIKNSFTKLQEEMLCSFSKAKGFISLIIKYFKYKRLFKKTEIKKPKNCLKVGIIGELYTCMEPFSNYYLEKELAKMNIEIDRFTNFTFLLIIKYLTSHTLVKRAKGYLKYDLGADGGENVARTVWLGEKKYDGIIHTKPFGCTPEVSAIPIISKVAEKYEIPIIYLTFDSQTSEEGIKTRLEAFYDMISERKKQNE